MFLLHDNKTDSTSRNVCTNTSYIIIYTTKPRDAGLAYTGLRPIISNPGSGYTA